MKIPLTPPPINQLFEMLNKKSDHEKYQFLINSNSIGPCDDKGRYLHWNKLRHMPPPEGFDSELYWLATKQARSKILKSLPFTDKAGNKMTFAIPDMIMRDILWISENATGVIQADPRITDNNTKKTYLINSLIEESISSSQLEGASTTRRVAKEMIRTGRKPRDHSEKMIVNNYNAMKFIREYKTDKLTQSMIFELHKILTEDTLSDDDKAKAGAFRSISDNIGVYSYDNKLLHAPPKPDQLEQRLQLICDFANKSDDEDSLYIPPILRAIIVHFMIGYDHPFIDGNGRTARALFYWVMAKDDYWLMEYVSISRVIKKAPMQYMYAYLYTETDANDLTYFMIHQLDKIKESITDLRKYLIKKSTELRETDKILEHSKLRNVLNQRQLGILKNALKNPGAEYTIKSHQASHGISYQTARTDLMKLSDDYKVIKKYKIGKKDVFVSPPNIKDLIVSS